MNNYWSTRTLSSDSLILKKIGGQPGDYDLMWDRTNKSLLIKEQSSGNQWNFPLSSSEDVRQLLNDLNCLTRDDLTHLLEKSKQSKPNNLPIEVKLLNQLSDLRYQKGWTRWKQSNYEIRIKMDSTGFVKDVLIQRIGAKKVGGKSDHIHIYHNPATNEKGLHLTVIKNGKSDKHEIDKKFDDYKTVYDLIDNLINEFFL